ncbi:hypothetical protein BDR05DRAFT_565703 [Suillus weaverae]|nr:hypothetical protein BDR05DRAFT_565703 [Suillus weaverae]
MVWCEKCSHTPIYPIHFDFLVPSGSIFFILDFNVLVCLLRLLHLTSSFDFFFLLFLTSFCLYVFHVSQVASYLWLLIFSCCRLSENCPDFSTLFASFFVRNVRLHFIL